MTKKLGGHPTAERAAEIKASVVAATMKAFAEKGSGFSMDEVARLADVSKQAIYRRWRSKIDLVVEAIETALNDGLSSLTECPEDPVAALKEVAWRHFGGDQTASHRLSIYLQVESFSNERLRGQLVEWRSRFISIYKQALHEIENAGHRASGEMEMQSELLMELLNGGAQKLALTGLTSVTDQRRCFEERWNAFKLIAIRD